MSLTTVEFAARLKAQGRLWGLCDRNDAWAMHEDPEDGSEAMPVWLDESSARACAVGEWAGFSPAALTLEEFIRDWLPALDEEVAWVGLNFSGDHQGDLVSPEELRDLLAAAS